MKAAANGALNVSVADGWWPEGADEMNGWTIGGERTYKDQALQNQLDSQTLYALLEDEIAPLFFQRDADGLPTAWLERSRHALATLPPVFDTARMVRQYASQAYLPAAKEGLFLAADRRAGARKRAQRKARLRELFPRIKVTDASVADLSSVLVGDSIDVRLSLDLGQLTPEEVTVELVLGHARNGGTDDLVGAVVVPLARVGAGPAGTHVYEGGHRIERSGAYAYGLRVRASDDLGDPLDALRDLVRWVG
jgi:starch phosphorylase